MAWHLGNTSVRNPYRMRDALIALKDSPLLQNLDANDSEQKLALLLYDSNVVEPTGAMAEHIQRARTKVLPSEHPIPFLWRKWRVGLTKLGFLVPQTSGTGETAKRSLVVSQNGERLIAAEKTSQEQNCYLRAILALRPDEEDRAFSPLHLVVGVLHELERRAAPAHLTFNEIALLVQNYSSNAAEGKLADAIIDFRIQRSANEGNIRKFVSDHFASVAKAQDVTEDTLRDYADMNIRYLKATGLFVSSGRGITLNPNTKAVADLIAEQIVSPLPEPAYRQTLATGAALPTDDAVKSANVIATLLAKLEQAGVAKSTPDLAALDAKGLEMLRLDLQDSLTQVDERNFAKAQALALPEIIVWLKAIESGKAEVLPNGETARVPKSERPAYLEWAIWRAFLAINSLVNEPWEARRFRVDNEFLPVGPAPGGGPDMVFEFTKTLMVVEVTLTNNSRQEAAEGESVRRHVADFEDRAKGKRLYGLFIAPQVDNNTAHTFRLGEWYRKDESLFNVDIVPFTLSSFVTLLEAVVSKPHTLVGRLPDLLTMCRARANLPAPHWKTDIAANIESLRKDLLATP